MGAILNPFANILNPGKYQVPSGKLTIDWGHPLARGLLSAWVPGAMGCEDIAGLCSPLVAASPTSFLAATNEGPAVGGGGSEPNLTTPAPVLIKSFTTISLYWRGFMGALIVGSVPLVVAYANPNISPFFVFGIGSGTANTTFRVAWNAAGTFTQLNVLSQLSDNMFCSMAATADVPGNSVIPYLNGVQKTGEAFGAAQNTTATSPVLIGAGQAQDQRCNCAYIWNRVLTAEEMMAMHLDPYGFLVPAEYEMPIMTTDVIMGLHSIGASMPRIIRPIAYSPDR